MHFFDHNFNSIFCSSAPLWNARPSTTGLAVNATSMNAWKPPRWQMISGTMSDRAALKLRWLMKAWSRILSLKWAFFNLFASKQFYSGLFGTVPVILSGSFDCEEGCKCNAAICVHVFVYRCLDPCPPSRKKPLMMWPLKSRTRRRHLSIWYICF